MIKNKALKNDFMELIFSVDPDSFEKLKGLKVGYISFENVLVEKSHEQVDNLVNAASNQVKERFKTIPTPNIIFRYKDYI